MRTRQNKLSLIGRLPLEIPCRIFSFHAINQPANEGDLFLTGTTKIKLGWNIVTHVCSHWRSLSEPTLWRTVVFRLEEEWALEMLEISLILKACLSAP